MVNKLNVLESVNTLVDTFDEGISYNEIMILYSLQCRDKELFNVVKERCKSLYYFTDSIDWLIRNQFIKNSSSNPYSASFDTLDIINPDALSVVNLLDVNVETTSHKLDKDEVVAFIDKWYELWPTGVRTAGYLVRSGKKPVVKKMIKFMQDYPEFSYDIIIEATAQYIKRCSLKGYAFMKTASYFITKDGESTLAGECERVVSNPTTISTTPTAKSSGDDSKLL